MLVPHTLAAPVLVVITSAICRTVVATRALVEVPSLFEPLGSMVVAVLEARLVNTPLAGAVTVTVKLVVAPALSVAMVGHDTSPSL